MPLNNNNGLLIDENGVVRGIEVPISDEPVTGFKRVARHECLSIDAGLQMLQRVRIVKLNSAGQELSTVVRDATINPNVRAQLLNAYQDTFYPAQTEGAFVDPATGLPVEDGTEGAIEELAFFQGITIGVLKSMGQTVTNTTSVPVLVYTLLLGQILKLDAQGRL